MMNEKHVSEKHLEEIELFHVLSQRTLRCIAEKASRVVYQAGVDLYTQGQPPSGFFVLLDGRVKLQRQSQDKVQILALLIPNECFGAESLPTGAPSPYAATTLTEVNCLFIPPDILQTLLDDHVDFQEAFLKLITDRLKQFVTLVHDLAFRDVTSRLAMVLVLRAEREGEYTKDGIYFERLLSQQEFAAMVGTAREVVYRTLKKFEKEHLIKTTRESILILDLPALTDIAGQEYR